MPPPRPTVAVIGEALVDVFDGHAVPGGAPFNVARHLAALAESPLMVTRIGLDALGARIEAEFDRFGLSRAGLQRDASRRTGEVSVHLAQGQPTFSIGSHQAWDAIDADEAVRVVREADPWAVCFGTLSQREPASREAVHAVLAATPALRLLDMNLREPHAGPDVAAAALHLADIVKVNEDEAHRLLDWFAPGRPPRALLTRFGLRRLVITRGAQGWRCIDAEQGESEGPAPAVEVVDTVGAGDAFTAVLLVGERRGWPLAQTLGRASTFAAQVCTLRGAAEAGHAIYAQTLADWGVLPHNP